MAVATTAILTGCNNKESKVETTEFVDDVKVALADSGRIDLSKLQWTREPKAFEVKGDTIAIMRHRDVSRQRELAERVCGI